MRLVPTNDEKTVKPASETVSVDLGYTFKQFYIPERMMAGITRYIEQGIKPGNFLSAIIQNDLNEAVSRADDDNLMNLPAYVGYFYNEAPSGCYGSPEIMDAWLARFHDGGDPA